MKHGNNGNQTLTIRDAKPSPNLTPPLLHRLRGSNRLRWSLARLRNCSRQSPKARWCDFPLKRKQKWRSSKPLTKHWNRPAMAAAEAEATAELPKLLAALPESTKSTSPTEGNRRLQTTPKEGEPNPLVSFGPEVEILPSAKNGAGAVATERASKAGER